MTTGARVTVAIANQKGGVGKTTTAVNLAAGLARRGVHTLLVDLDMQGSATATLTRKGDLEADASSIATCLEGETGFDEVLYPTTTPNLVLAPSGRDMAMVDAFLANAMARERVLSRAIDRTAGDHDVVIIDTAPYLGLLTLNALVAADYVIVPVTCEYLPILGLKMFNEMLTKVRARSGARAEVLGYLLTMVDRRERIGAEVETLLRRTFGPLILPHPIRVSTRHKASASHRQTIFQYDGKGSRGRQDYEMLTDEVIKRAGLSVPDASSRAEDACALRASSASS